MNKRELAALTWGSMHRGCNSLFKYVPVGGKFKWAKGDNEEVFVKTKSGYRRLTGGRTFRTGQLTAVYYIEEHAPTD